MTASAPVDALHARLEDVVRRQDRQETDLREGLDKFSQKLDRILFWLLSTCASVALGAIGIIVTLLVAKR